MRWAWALPAAAVAAGGLLFARPAVGAPPPVRVESSDETDGVAWCVSGYAVGLVDPAVAVVALRAAAAGTPLHVHAVALSQPWRANLTGIPFLRLYAHHCAAAGGSGNAVLTLHGSLRGGAAAAAAPRALRGVDGVTPAAAEAGAPSGNAIIWCVTVDPSLHLAPRRDARHGRRPWHAGCRQGRRPRRPRGHPL